VLSPVIRFPQVDGLVPERYATRTPTDRPAIKKRSKTDRHERNLLALRARGHPSGVPTR
jgi:hypothetical protein